MVSKRFTAAFKLEAIKQITEKHYSTAEVSERPRISTHSLYAWIKKIRLDRACKIRISRPASYNQTTAIIQNQVVLSALHEETLTIIKSKIPNYCNPRLSRMNNLL
jgi:transposase-like protein